MSRKSFVPATFAAALLASVSFSNTSSAAAQAFYAVAGHNNNNTLFVDTSQLSQSYYVAPYRAIDNGGNIGGGFDKVRQSDYLDINGKPLPLSWTLNHYYTYIAAQVCGDYGLHVATIPDLVYQDMATLFGPINQYRLDEFLLAAPYAIGANGQLTPYGISLIPQGTVNTQIATVLYDTGARVWNGLPEIGGLFLGIPSQFGDAPQGEALKGVSSDGLLVGSNCKNPPGSLGDGCLDDPPVFIGALVCST